MCFINKLMRGFCLGIYEARDWNKSSFVRGTHQALERWKERLKISQICRVMMTNMFGLSSPTISCWSITGDFFSAEILIYRNDIFPGPRLRVDPLHAAISCRDFNVIKNLAYRIILPRNFCLMNYNPRVSRSRRGHEASCDIVATHIT